MKIACLHISKGPRQGEVILIGEAESINREQEKEATGSSLIWKPRILACMDDMHLFIEVVSFPSVLGPPVSGHSPDTMHALHGATVTNGLPQYEQPGTSPSRFNDLPGVPTLGRSQRQHHASTSNFRR